MGHIFVGEKHKYAKLLNFMKNQRKEHGKRTKRVKLFYQDQYQNEF